MTETMKKVLHLLSTGRDPFAGCRGRAVGARTNCLYALQHRGLVDSTRGGWRITGAGRKAVQK